MSVVGHAAVKPFVELSLEVVVTCDATAKTCGDRPTQAGGAAATQLPVECSQQL